MTPKSFKKFLITNRDYLTILVFIILLVFSIYHHEPWGDELQAWSIARSSDGLLDLYYNLRYEGNAGLWHLFLFFASRISRSHILMQTLNATFAVGAIFILNRFSKFNYFQKLFFTFSYFPLYEYGTIARNYGLGMFLFFFALALYEKRNSKLLLISIVCATLALSGPYGAMLALAYASVLIWDRIKSNKTGLESKIFVPNILLIISFVFLSFVLSIPPKNGSDNYSLSRTYKDPKLIKETVSAIWKSYVPIPQDIPMSWGTNIIDKRETAFTLSLVLFVIALISFSYNSNALIMYLGGTGFLLLFSYTKFTGALRHEGHLYLVLIGCYWIFYNTKPQIKTKLSKSVTFIASIFIGVLLITQTIAAIYSINKDVNQTFHYAKDVAAHIKEKNLQDLYIVGDTDGTVAPVTMYLDRSVYFPKAKRKGTFLIFDNKRVNYETPDKTLGYVSERYNDDSEPILLLVSYQIDAAKYPVTFFGKFEEAISTKKTIYIYVYGT